MICYKDMTFCKFYNTCSKGSTCKRALTTDVMERAEYLEMLIAQFANKPDCYTED